MEDALAMAEEVLRLSMDFYFESRRPVPAPSKPKRGQVLVTLPAKVSAKVIQFNERLSAATPP